MILQTIITMVTGAAVAWYLNTRLERVKDELERDRFVGSHVWQMKKDACLHALNAANAVLSNYKYENPPKEGIIPQFERIETIRACYNELACTCESPNVLKQLKRVMYERVTPDAIVDLRNAVRHELGFSDEEIDKDRENAFVAKTNCQPPNGAPLQAEA